MTGPEFVTIGGVKYDASQIKQQVSRKEAEKIGGIFKEYTAYEVVLKNGVIVSTDSRSEKEMLARKAEVIFADDIGHATNFKGLSKAEILDYNNSNNIHRLMGCEFTHMKTSDYGNAMDDVIVGARRLPDGTIQESNNNKFTMGPNDKYNLSNDKTGMINYKDEGKTELDESGNVTYSDKANKDKKIADDIAKKAVEAEKQKAKDAARKKFRFNNPLTW
ncbi:MAG: hypothetical protein LBJ74_00820 [Heliobacteriaceae bacterium]|jgi:hypothetical protein|nr:hypothetical protein [Heliobacteriaceae bacterium]